MPELPEVETVRRGLATVMEGQIIAGVTVNRSDLRRPLPEGFARRLQGVTVTALGRRAKYLIAELSSGDALLIHLGMSGSMVIDPAGGASRMRNSYGRHEHVVFDMENGARVRFSDPRRFGLMDLAPLDALDSHPLLAHLGPEPTGDDFTGPRLAGLLRDKRTPIKAALLDQRLVAGLGNIYVCESLFQSGLSPRRSARNVQGARAGRLAAAVRSVLAKAIAAGGSTLRDHVAPSGEIGYFQHSFKVYGREGETCANQGCDARIRRIVQSGRSSFYCPDCQR
ncbi:MAG: bifunctional DNA-formamidopyrimidine glycosylase/DNA-(apurinic or apyrimidinic site) lyase [Alphaproteobacteria bacterium]